MPEALVINEGRMGRLDTMFDEDGNLIFSVTEGNQECCVEVSWADTSRLHSWLGEVLKENEHE